MLIADPTRNCNPTVEYVQKKFDFTFLPFITAATLSGNLIFSAVAFRDEADDECSDEVIREDVPSNERRPPRGSSKLHGFAAVILPSVTGDSGRETDTEQNLSCLGVAAAGTRNARDAMERTAGWEGRRGRTGPVRSAPTPY
ncbi:hypothetical protein Trydic_g5896 [Trypoxylus dichotomus]